MLPVNWNTWPFTFSVRGGLEQLSKLKGRIQDKGSFEKKDLKGFFHCSILEITIKPQEGVRWHPVVTDCESWCTDVMEISLAGAWTWAQAWKVPQEWLCTSQGSSKKVIGLCNHWCSPAFTNHLFTFTSMPTFLEYKKQLRSLFFPLLRGIVTEGWRQIPSVLGPRREKASVHP